MNRGSAQASRSCGYMVSCLIVSRIKNRKTKKSLPTNTCHELTWAGRRARRAAARAGCSGRRPTNRERKVERRRCCGAVWYSPGSLQPDCQGRHSRKGGAYQNGWPDGVGLRARRLNRRWCSPDDTDKDCKMMELLRDRLCCSGML